jgi:adenosylcobyric acid synthase
MARHANADVILVADIDRGGVFASTYGSIMLQTPEDKARIKGIIVNKFRGDLRLFESGRKMLEDLCGVPVLGVVPMFKDIVIEEEDSVELEQKHRSLQQGKVNIAVVLLRHISNFTDFNVLERDERVNLFYTNNIKDFEKADIIIIPGTKATLDDLYELRRNGVAQAIIRAHRNGTLVIGICGGYQMLGQTISDPDGIEGNIPQLPGLGLLNISTVMTAEKTTKQVEFEFEGKKCKGYEIHQGKTEPCTIDHVQCTISDAPQQGERKSPFKGDLEGHITQASNCIGTYIHGFLDNPSVIESILKPFGQESPSKGDLEGLEDFKDHQYDLLAEHVRKYVDMDKLYEIMASPPALPRREGVGAR